MKYNKIAFVGMMGCGKTTVSRALAKKICFNLVDLDFEFEKENEISIKDFFEKFGEDNFRKKETELLKKHLTKENIVISTGGGIILSEENRDLLFNSDILTIYLKTNPETIFDRIKSNKTRPLLLVENPKEKIKAILNERKKFYELSKETILTDNKTIEEITEEICKILK